MSRRAALADKIRELDKAEAELNNTPIGPRNEQAQYERKKLSENISAQRHVLREELNARQAYYDQSGRVNTAKQEADRASAQADEAAKAHEATKQQIFAKYRTRPQHLNELTAEDQQKYLASRAARDAARKAANDAADSALEEEVTLASIGADVDEAVATRQALIKAQGDPCLPCQVAALKREVADKAARQAAASRVFPGRQNYGNCGIESTQQIAAQAAAVGVADKNAKGQPKNELERLNHGLKHGAGKGTRDPNGKVKVGGLARKKETVGSTNASDRKEILEDRGVAMEDPTPTTSDKLATAIKDKKGVIVSVNGRTLWGKPQVPGRHSKHAIVVTDGEFDKDGKLTGVYINDTGALDEKNQRGRFVEIDKFQKACDDHGASEMNVTKDAIWP